MKKIGEDYWNYNGCDVYLAEHPKLQGKYEIYKGCDFIQRAYSLIEAKEVIINKFGKMSGGKRKGAGRKPAPYQTKTISFRVREEYVDEIKATVKAKLAELSQNKTPTFAGGG